MVPWNHAKANARSKPRMQDAGVVDFLPHLRLRLSGRWVAQLLAGAALAKQLAAEDKHPFLWWC